VTDAWAQYLKWRPEFVALLDPDYYTPEWLDQEVWSGRAQILSCEDAAALVEVRTYPTGAKDIHGLLCCGNLSSITHTLIPLWLDHGRSIGAISATVDSRAGWTRALKPLGFDPYQSATRKTL